ncbi:hypothetical protein LEMLEM_LOCUS12407 [Lemmus lemmus]
MGDAQKRLLQLYDLEASPESYGSYAYADIIMTQSPSSMDVSAGEKITISSQEAAFSPSHRDGVSCSPAVGTAVLGIRC